MALNALAALVAAAALFVPAAVLTRHGSFAMDGSPSSLLVPGGIALGAVAVVVAWFRAARALHGRMVNTEAAGERSCVLARPSAGAFDTVLGALGQVRGARIDASRTSVESGTLSATTHWRWVLGNGERIDVRLFPLDEGHVLVAASSYPLHRGTWGDHARDERNVTRLFAALPQESPSAASASSR
jgi:hypothetical protein